MRMRKSRQVAGWATTLVVMAGLNMTGPVRADSPKAPEGSPATSADKSEYGNRPLAYIYGNVPVTREDLGEFLIARGGADKLDLLINKKIIEHECAKRGVTVTEKELEAALLEDLEGLSIKKGDFVKVVLPRYGKTLYEWMEDVVRPRLLLTKLCRDRIVISDKDLQKQFDREFGEKRQVQIIMWPPNDDQKAILAIWEKIRSSQDEFDSVARAQANPGIAASAGHIKPISRHLPAQDKIIEDVAFQLKEGEVSQILKTSQGYMVMKMHRVIPPASEVKFEDVKPRLEKQAFEEAVALEIPKFFAELREEANPKVLFTGPKAWQTEQTQTVEADVEGEPEAGIVPASGIKPASEKPMTEKK